MGNFILETNKKQLDEFRISETSISNNSHSLTLSIERFALTANTLTYGVAGDLIGYWKFFPAEEPWGRIPCWGIGRVVTSNIGGIEVSDRFYGYFPMGSSLQVQPDKVTGKGFFDASPHRSELPPIYNYYPKMTLENGFDPAFDDQQILLRPLFLTAFVMDNHLADRHYEGAEALGLISASSKTALGIAHQTKNNRDIYLIGFTSDANIEFVKSTGLYDEVIGYSQISEMNNQRKLAVVDIAGNEKVVNSIRARLADKLRLEIGVGKTHWDSEADDQPAVEGVTRESFFAPTIIADYEKNWGEQTYSQRFESAWGNFCQSAINWLPIKYLNGKPGLLQGYRGLLKGTKPNEGIVVKP